MSAQRYQQQGVQTETKSYRQAQTNLDDEPFVTPGRAPAEGPATDVETPTHERWAQHTPDRAPAEGS